MDTDDVNSGCPEYSLSLDGSMTSAQACYQAHHSRVEWDHLIATISLRIRQSLHLPAILQISVDEVQQLLECDRVLIYQFTPDWCGQVTVEAVSSPQWSLLTSEIHPCCFEANWIHWYQEERSFVCADIRTANLTPSDAEMLQHFQVIANLTVPIMHEDELWGLLIAHHCTTAYTWESQHLVGLQQIAVHLGIAVHQALLVEQLQAANAILKTQVQERTHLLEYTSQELLGEVYERQQAKDVIFQQAEFWRQVLNSLFAFVGILNPKGIVLEINQAALNIADLTQEDVIGEAFAETYWWSYDPTAQAKVQEAIAQANQGEIVQLDIAVQIKAHNQIIVDFSFMPLWDKTGAVTHIILSGIDITERKQTEAILRKSEATNRALIEAIPDFLVRMRQDGTHLKMMNEEMVHCLRSESAWVEEQSILEIMPTPIAQERIVLAQRAIATQQPQGQEYQFEDGGNTYYEEARIIPLWKDDVLVVVRDITSRKQAELELQTTKEQLELFIQATSEGFWDWNLITNEIYLSPRWKEMLGYRDDELDNTLDTWVSMMVESDRHHTLQLIQNYNTDKVNEFKTIQRFQHKDGFIVHLFIRAIHVKNDQGQVVRMVVSHMDMTATMAMQTALKTSELQLRSILNSTLDGIMAFRSVRDEQGQIVDFEWLISNPAACTMVNRPANTLIGQRLLDKLPGNLYEGLFDLYVQVVESGEPIQHQFRYDHDGINSWFENIAVKLEDGFAVAFRNITAKKQSEQALQKANCRLEEKINDLKQRNTEMRLLSETSDFLQACCTIDEACTVISSLLQPLFPDCSGSIFMTNSSRNRAESVAVWGDRLYSRPNFIPYECWALRRGRPHWVRNNRVGLRCDHVLQYGEQLGEQNERCDEQNSERCDEQNSEQNNGNGRVQSDRVADTLCIPMIAQGETIGLFYLSSASTEALPDSKRQLAQTVAEQIGLAIANLRLRETLHSQSIRDPLTGLFNRRYLEEALAQELVRAQRNQHPIGIIMIDVDHFKDFNDTFGHDAGDFVLQTISNLLQENVRGSDIACRYGGEELTLVLPESSLGATATRAETLRRAISHLQLKHDNQRLERLTASFGVSCFPQHGISGSALIQAADAALYRAKSSGRNQVVTAI